VFIPLLVTVEDACEPFVQKKIEAELARRFKSSKSSRSDSSSSSSHSSDSSETSRSTSLST